MRIKQDSILNLLESISIVDVVSDYVRLKKVGRNYVGLCPFHSERTPSFSVSPDKNLFHCFGCKEGGNAVSFIMKIEKIPFVEAIETLSKKFNIPIEYEQGNFVEKDLELEKLYEYSQIVGRYFYDNLTKTDEGRNALKYLHSRGISDETIKTFNLGYALSSWDGLISFINKNKLEFEIFEKLGLISKKDNRYYDIFRGRIIFPIYSTIGKIIAFGGRKIIGDEKQSKYINSPETRIYVKGKTLYGLFHAKDFIRKADNVILVEGYMDFLSLYQNGFKNVLATAGTALTIDQLNLVSRFTQNVNLIFDGDEAGQKAAIRSIELLLKTDLEFKIITLPEDEDPDLFIRKYGAQKFKEKLHLGKNYIDFIYDYSLSKKDLNDTSIKTKVVKSLLEYTAKVKDPVRREIFVNEIAEKFNVRANSLFQAMTEYLDEPQKITNASEISGKNPDEIQKVKKQIENMLPVEKEMLKLLCEGDKNVNDIIFLYVNSRDFFNEKAREIFEIIKNEYDNKNVINSTTIMSIIQDDELKSILADAIFEKYTVSKDWQDTLVTQENFSLKEIAHDLIRKLKKLVITYEIKKNQDKLKTAESYDESMKYIEIDKYLKEEIRRLNSPDYFKL